jgi:hypothetical protein
LTAPAAWALVTAVIVVGPVTVKLAAAVVPNLTAVASMKPEPEIVTVVPPVVVPVPGVNEAMVGAGAVYLKSLDDVRVPPLVTTVIVTVPGTWAGALAWIAVVPVKWNVPARTVTVPNRTAVTPPRYVPLMVTGVPPVVGPPAGVKPEMVGRCPVVSGVTAGESAAARTAGCAMRSGAAGRADAPRTRPAPRAGVKRKVTVPPEVTDPPGAVTVMRTVAEACASVTALIVVGLVTV